MSNHNDKNRLNSEKTLTSNVEDNSELSHKIYRIGKNKTNVIKQLYLASIHKGISLIRIVNTVKNPSRLKPLQSYIAQITVKI